MLTGGLGLLGVALVILIGVGSFNATSGHDTGTASAPHASHRRHRRRPASPPPDVTTAPAAPHGADQQALARTLTKQLGLAGGQGAALVYDLGAGQDVFALGARVRRPPASIEKIYTTVALMKRLGPQARLHTSVLGTGRLVGGVWHGNLYLRGDGDPTFGDAGFDKVWENGYGASAQALVAALLRHGIHAVTGAVFADESLFDRARGGLLTDYAPDTPDFGGQLSALTYDHGSALRRLSPARFAAKEFGLTMRGAGITAAIAGHTATTPRRARLLATVSSPPLGIMTRLMDVPSDDLFAELFTKQLGVRFGRGGTISDGARVIGRTIASYGVHPTILDGSGLGYHDRTSPAEIVDLLRDVWHTPVGRQLASALPTVGLEGTVQGIGRRTAAQGRCIAKTGTLDYVTNLAGYCHTVTGRQIAFALFVDGPPNGVAVPLISKMIAAIARY